MDEYAGRVLADRYRLPLPPSDAFELVETRGFDTYSGQEVLVRQLPLPEVVEAEMLDGGGVPGPRQGVGQGRTTLRAADPVVRRAIEAAEAAARIPDHPRLDQVFDVFAEGGSLWIVSELVAARPLAALLAERPLNPYRAAEIASDVLTALRALHVHGWTHRNITARTVLICDDGRVVLTGLASGAAEEALCGYDPVPPEEDDGEAEEEAGAAARQAALAPPVEQQAAEDPRAARAGAIAAYRAGARAAARAAELPPALPPGYGPAAGSPYGPVEQVPPAAPPGPPPPRRAELAGTWSDEARGGGSGAGSWHGAAPRSGRSGVGEGMHADELRQAAGPGPGTPAVPEPPAHTGRWDEAPAAPGSTRPRSGPATPLAAERARQARITVVGAVTERWAPEQAGPVHENWQLAAPVGPATDLWALGALLFRAVQGHAPYPEESAAELVQLVCAEPPAFAEECGPLRPVVESLLRQDPTERPDVEELRGWLRSLVRSAPEPEAGQQVVPLPAADATKLPVIRRRGELVRRKKRGSRQPVATAHGRHRQQHGRQRLPKAEKAQRAQRAPKAQRTQRKPRSLGRMLLVVILVVLIAALVYAMKFMPKASDDDGQQKVGSAPAPKPTPTASATPSSAPESSSPPQNTPSTESDSRLPAGYGLRNDPAGFRIAVDKSWTRRAANSNGQIRYLGGDFELVVVPGRDTVKADGSDPMAYQNNKERELQPFRDSSWSQASGLRRIDVGQQAMAEGQFSWQDSSGRQVYVRNLAMIIGGKYHIVQVIGPDAQRDKVTEIYQQASATYRVGT
ncbi:protein kinase [Streptomyces sp. NBC_01465]|uniref:protein kinase n=1 Tax=Streptomyces sp. NBC_01465 TaxID=2903878 RepID=UPI002E3428E5|nr:protein kinase [Streptomyces sp. NBC_01465]